MANSASNEGDVFDEDRLCRLIEMMKEHDLSEVDLQEDTQRIRLRRNTGPAAPSTPGYGTPAVPATPEVPAGPAIAAEADNIVVVKSPMVGTFYSRPNPKSPSFVKVGDHVDPEKTICIAGINAPKLARRALSLGPHPPPGPSTRRSSPSPPRIPTA